MKKLSIILTAAAMCFSSVAHADTCHKQDTYNKNKAPIPTQNEDFCWGIAVVGLAVLGTVVGLTAASAAPKPVSYSN